MTTKQELLTERDRLACDFAGVKDLGGNKLDITAAKHMDYRRAMSDFKAGFDACLALVEERRVRPLRDVITDALEAISGMSESCLHCDENIESAECSCFEALADWNAAEKMFREALLQVPELEGCGE